MPRHQLTPKDRRKGGLNHAKKHGHQGHKLTQADRRRGGLATAAKKRAERAAKLFGVSHKDLEVQVLGADPAIREGLFCGCTPEGPSLACAAEGLWHGLKVTARNGPELRAKVAERVAEWQAERATTLPPGPGVEAFYRAMMAGPAPVTPAGAEWMRDDFNATKLGKVMAEKLLTSPPHIPTMKMGNPCDPFTLSALKRFRLGPLSPLALTRSQRAHVEIMLAGGWVEKTPEAMIRLTAKGEAALANEEVSNG